MIIYVYKKCSTCKDALTFLKKKGAIFTAKEITVIPPSIEELKQMLAFQDGNLKKLFNTTGLLYKEMELKEKLDDIKIEEALFLLQQHGMLVKRPFLLDGDFGLLGFKESEWSKKI